MLVATFVAMIAVTACAAPTTDMPTTPAGKEGLFQDQLHLLGLAYGQYAAMLWDFLKVENDYFFQNKSYLFFLGF